MTRRLAVLALWLLVGCDERQPDRAPRPAPPPSYDTFHAALEESSELTLACIGSVRAAFDRAALAGPTIDRPPPSRAPADRAELRSAIVFEVPISIEGDVANCAPSSLLPIHELQDVGVFAHVDHDAICGIHDRIDALGMWPDRAQQGIAKLRAPKSVPPLVLYYSRWCDRQLDFRGPFTCSVALTWMRLPSKEVIASASGVGHGQPRDPDGAYASAMSRAEEKAVSVVRGWK